MVTIVAISSYYRTSSCVFVYNDNDRPTTTAQYVVLTPASSETLTTRNAAIAKDVTAWGWHVYNTDPSLPNMEKWFKKYEAAAKKNTWDEDIWRIWQREHGVRIAEEEAKLKAVVAGEKGKVGAVLHSAKKAGGLFSKLTMTLDYDERRLRQEEAGKEEKKRWKLADDQLVARSTDLPPDPFADTCEIVEDGRKTGKLRGGGGADAKGTSVEETTASNPVVLTRHSWLLGD